MKCFEYIYDYRVRKYRIKIQAPHYMDILLRILRYIPRAHYIRSQSTQDERTRNFFHYEKTPQIYNVILYNRVLLTQTIQSYLRSS
jgi:hypothetical protein